MHRFPSAFSISYRSIFISGLVYLLLPVYLPGYRFSVISRPLLVFSLPDQSIDGVRKAQGAYLKSIYPCRLLSEIEGVLSALANERKKLPSFTFPLFPSFCPAI
jgi:hypothetical protein